MCKAPAGREATTLQAEQSQGQGGDEFAECRGTCWVRGSTPILLVPSDIDEAGLLDTPLLGHMTIRLPLTTTSPGDSCRVRPLSQS